MVLSFSAHLLLFLQYNSDQNIMELKFNIIEGNSKFTKRKNDFQRNGMDRVHNPDHRHWIGPKLKLRVSVDKRIPIKKRGKLNFLLIYPILIFL